MMKCETGEMRDGDGHKNVSIPVQDVGGVRGRRGRRGGGVGPARQSGTSRGGQKCWVFLITPSSSVYMSSSFQPSSPQHLAEQPPLFSCNRIICYGGDH